MTTAATMTSEAFLRQPATKPADEYACGRVFQKPMPTLDHLKLQAFPELFLGFSIAVDGIFAQTRA